MPMAVMGNENQTMLYNIIYARTDPTQKPGGFG